jgi:hypothetical protein
MPKSDFDDAVAFFEEELDVDPSGVNGKTYVVFPVSADVEPDELFELEPEARERGAYLFLAEPATGEDDYALGLAPTTDQFEAVRLVGTQATSGSPNNADIVAFLRETHAADPIIVDTITPDAVGARFKGPVRNPRALATRLYAFCPGVYEALAADIEADPEVAEALGLPEGTPWHDPIEVLTAGLVADGALFLFWD